MTRLGPYGNGDCSRSYDGTLSLRGSHQLLEVECYVNSRRPPIGVKMLHHGGSANLAVRDGHVAIMGKGHLKLLDAESLAEVRSIPSVVTCGFQGWDKTNFSRHGAIAGHSVPAGLATIYWLESGLVSVRCGGDIGVRPEGFEFLRVSGDSPIPGIRRESNQREWLGVCDGNPVCLVTQGGNAYGRMYIEVFDGVVKCPGPINNPSYISTPECHYVIAPGTIRQQPARMAMIDHTPGLSIRRIGRDKTVDEVFVDMAMNVWTGWSGSYLPQPQCLKNGTIYAWTRTNELSAISTETWIAAKYVTTPLGPKPRLAVNRNDVAVLYGSKTLCRPGKWSITVDADAEILSTNKQFCNHLAIDDSFVYLARLLSGKLVIGVYALSTGTQVNNVTISIPGSDSTGQCHDFFAWGGALYALVTPREVMLTEPKRFSQFVVRVA